MKDRIEDILIEGAAFALGILLCGSVAPEIRIPAREVVLKVYDGAKTVGRGLGKLLYPDNYPLY